MARVYRHTYGGGRTSKKWYVEYRTAKGRKIREPAYVSKELSIGYLAECLKREELIRAGRYVMPATEAALDTLLDRWHAYMQGRGFTARHCHYYRRACRVEAIKRTEAR